VEHASFFGTRRGPGTTIRETGERYWRAGTA
jgi:hypothetical protein